MFTNFRAVRANGARRNRYGFACSPALQGVVFSIIFGAGFAAPALADDWTANLGQLSINYGASGGIGGFFLPQDNFGGGSYNYRSAENYLSGKGATPPTKVEDPAWAEPYVIPEVRASFAIDKTNSINIDVSAVYGATLGSGDASLLSTTAGHVNSIQLEQAWVSYKTGVPFGWKGDSTVFKFGSQDFSIDDGFLLGLGTKDLGNRAAYYMGPKLAFDGPGMISLNYDPVRADIFALSVKSNQSLTFDTDQPETDFAGFDATWFRNAASSTADGAVNYGDRARYVTVTYFNIYKSDDNPAMGFDNNDYSDAKRQGLNAFSVSMGGNMLPFDFLDLKDNGTLYGQFVKEYNSGTYQYGNDKAVNASAFYIEPGYTFNASPWTPHIYYRFTYFSGQKGGDGTGTKHSYDPLFYTSFIRGSFGSWYIGEITGNYIVGNSNIQVNQIGASINPPIHLFNKSDSLKLDLIGYDFDMVAPQQYGAINKKLDDEIDAAAEYTMNPLTQINVSAGVALPGLGGRQMTASTAAQFGSTGGIKSNTYMLEAYVLRYF